MYKALRFTLVSLLMMLCGTAFAADVTLAAGTNGSACTVNTQDGIKVGTSKAGGDMKITVPANTVKLTLHAAAWKGVSNLSVSISGATASPESITLTADDGITSNSPFTLKGNEDNFKFEITLSDVTTETTLTLAAEKRFVVWGASAEVSGDVTPPSVATPVISPNGGTFLNGAQLVTLSCETEGATMYYTTDGSDPAEKQMEYQPGGFRVVNTCTVKAIAFVGEAKSAVASATFTKIESYATIAALNALENNTPFNFTGEAIVIAKPTAKYVYIHDNTGNSLIYDVTGEKTAAAEVGKYISANWTGKVSIYNKLFELVPDQALAVKDDPAQPITYPEGTFSDATVNSVITLKKVDSYSVSGKNITIHLQGDDKNIDEAYGAYGYNQFGLEIAAAEEGKLYDIVGAVGKYNDKLQFWPIEIKEHAEPQPEPELSFYIVGNMTNWEIDAANKMTMNEIVEKEQHIKEFSLDMTLAAGAEFKAVSSTDGKTIKSWFPEGEGNNYTISEAGDYTIYFRPNADGADDWYYKFIYAAKNEPTIALEEGKYYLYNVAADGYVVGGNNWGTRASISKLGGIEMEVVAADDKYELKTAPAYAGKHLGFDGYVDNGKEANWTIVPVEGQAGVFTMSTDGTNVLFWDGGEATTTSVGAMPETAANAHWMFITKEAREAAFANATAENPADATFFIVNPDFGRASNKAVWQGDDFSIGGGDHVNNNAEKWGGNSQNFDVHQTVTVPDGKYKLVWNGFYRYNNTTENTNDVAAAAHSAGTEVINSFVYANDSIVPLTSIADEAAVAINGGMPFSQAEAAAAFAKGAYEQSLEAVVIGGNLTIGVKKTNHEGTDWTIWDNFRLFYIGGVPAELFKPAYNTALANAQAALANEDYAAVTGEEKTALEAAIREYGNVEDNADAYKAATAALTTATTTFTGAKAAYQGLADAKTEIEMIGYDARFPYAAEAKKEAAAASMNVVPTNAEDATAKTAAIYKAYRQFAESNALLEGIEGAVNMTDKIVNPKAEEAIAEPWAVVLGEGSGGSLKVLDGEPWTDGDDVAEHKYFDGGNWGANAWDVSLKQDITLPAGKYMLTAKGRAETAVQLTLFAGEESNSTPSLSSVGGLFGRGWNDISVEFELANDSTITIGVKGVTEEVHNWMSFSDFRLVQFPAEPAEPVYYVVGTMNEWTPNEDYKLTLNEEASVEEYSITLNLEANAELKVVSNKNVWYPDGTDNNFKINDAGNYTIYFQPNFNADWNGYIFAVKNEAIAHTWDFTQWSNETVANLKADAAASKVAGWSDVEKKTDAEADADPTEASKDNCFWATVTPDENGELSANGVVIEELKGLAFNPTYSQARSLAIAVNYPSTSLGDYAGPAYLWLGGGGKNVDCFVIKNVKAGTAIKMGVETHKIGDARGVQLFIEGAEGARGDKLVAPDGSEVAAPTAYTEQTWAVPGEEGKVVNIIVYNTKGCHIYYIDAEIGEPIPDGISTLKNAIENGIVYNMNGQKVNKAQKGLYIINGRKVVIK